MVYKNYLKLLKSINYAYSSFLSTEVNLLQAR